MKKNKYFGKWPLKKRPPLLAAALMVCIASGAHAASAGFTISGASFQKQVKSFKEMRTENIVTQSLDYSCGPAALATILRYQFNDAVTEKEIIGYLLLTTDINKVKEKKGFSLLDLKRYANAKGYEAAGYRMDVTSLVNLGSPVLVPINIKDYDHFVVFRSFKNGRVFLADPVLGKMSMRVDKFANIWKGGVGLVISRAGANEADAGLNHLKEDEEFSAELPLVQHILNDTALGKTHADGEF